MGRHVFAQGMVHLSLTNFCRCVTHYRGAHKVKKISCLDNHMCMAFT